MDIRSFSPFLSPAFSPPPEPEGTGEPEEATQAGHVPEGAEAANAPATAVSDSGMGETADSLPLQNDLSGAWRGLLADGAQAYHQFLEAAEKKAAEWGLGGSAPPSAPPAPPPTDPGAGTGVSTGTGSTPTTTGVSGAASTGTPAEPPAVVRTYTTNPAEVPSKLTPISPSKDVYPAVKRLWPEGGEGAARMIAAHCKLETGGTTCYNYNIGNHKALHKGNTDLHLPHTYQPEVSERVSEKQYNQWKSDPALAPLVKLESVDPKQKGHEYNVRVFPPHPAAAFAVHNSLDEAVQSQINVYKRLCNEDPAFKTALDRDDPEAIGHLLKEHGYYTDTEAHYTGMLVSCHHQVDKALAKQEGAQ